MGKHVDMTKAPEPHHKDYPKDGNPKHKVKHRKSHSDNEIEDSYNEIINDGINIIDKNDCQIAGGIGSTILSTSGEYSNKVKTFLIENQGILIKIAVLVVICIILIFLFNKSKKIKTNIELFDGNRSKKQERSDTQGTVNTDEDWNLSEKIQILIDRQNKLLN